MYITYTQIHLCHFPIQQHFKKIGIISRVMFLVNIEKINNINLYF